MTLAARPRSGVEWTGRVTGMPSLLHCAKRKPHAALTIVAMSQVTMQSVDLALCYTLKADCAC